MTVAASALGLDDEAQVFLLPGDPRRAAMVHDPHPFFDRIRSAAPVFQVLDGRWLVTGYDEAYSMFRIRSMSTSPSLPPDQLTLGHRIFMGAMVFRDPPAHTRLRRAVSTLFTPRAIERWRDAIDRASRDLLATVRHRDGFDFLDGPAHQLPIQVIARLMGLPAEDVARFHAWPDALLFIEEHPDARGGELAHIDEVAQTALDYFTTVIADRRAHPRDDLISGLIRSEGGEPLTDEEIVSMCAILHIGGHHTTHALLSNGIFHMTRQPETFGLLRARPELIPNAVEEMLRYEPPVPVTAARRTTEEIELAGVRIPQGDTVLGVVSAANRDPGQMEDPHHFDVTRAEPRHLSFASGIHACIGMSLARMEAAQFLKVLLTEYPRLELAVDHDEVPWFDSYMFRCPASLKVRWCQ